MQFVPCEAWAIVLHTAHRVSNQPNGIHEVVFGPVQGHRFKDDAFGNIVFESETISGEELLNDFGDKTQGVVSSCAISMLVGCRLRFGGQVSA
jgi:hypothetical protein